MFYSRKGKPMSPSDVTGYPRHIVSCTTILPEFNTPPNLLSKANPQPQTDHLRLDQN